MIRILRFPFQPILAWWNALQEQRHLRKEYPNGGRCHTCGTATADGDKICKDCWSYQQW